jgi:hypothetical protein
MLFYAYLILAGLLLTYSVLMTLHTWENRRFVRSRMRELHAYRPIGRVALYAPCKGVDLSLEENLRALLQQDYHDFEVYFILESAADPAYDVVRRIIAQHPRIAAHLVVAGLATDCGQKVHNLRRATAHIPADVKYLAFVDSDACPRPEWLRSLLLRLERPGVGAATGYRWFVPVRPSLANHLLYAINASIASFFGAGGRHLVWGGSWAIRRELFDSLAVRDAWQRTLSDDLVVSRILKRHQLRVLFQPPCMVASPLDHDLRSMCGFLRRQYLIGRFYVPKLWLAGLGLGAVTLVVLAGSLVLAVSAIFAHTVSIWIPAAVFLAHYGLSAARAAIRQSLVESFLPAFATSLRRARRFDVWAGPLVGLANLVGLVGAMFGREFLWRGIRYRLRSDGQVEALRHQITSSPPSPCPQVFVLNRTPVQPVPWKQAG